MKKQIADGFGLIHDEHVGTPAPRVGRGDRVTFTHPGWRSSVGAFTCTFSYDPDDVTVTRNGGHLYREVWCPKCREEILISSRWDPR